MRANGIGFVGEECKPLQDTIPRRLAAELGCKYAEIDMAAEERERNGIPKNYERLGEDEQERSFAIREEYMVARVYRESSLQASKLIVCGALHINSLAKRFHDRGEIVTTRNLLNEEWCDLPWDRMIRGEL